jgi:hypothetical protein
MSNFEGYTTKTCPSCSITLTYKDRHPDLKICALCKFDHVEAEIKNAQPELLTKYKDNPKMKELINEAITNIRASWEPIGVVIEPRAARKVKVPRNRKL